MLYTNSILKNVGDYSINTRLYHQDMERTLSTDVESVAHVVDKTGWAS